jgi:uncharacterized protein YggL (DUF469 family)
MRRRKNRSEEKGFWLRFNFVEGVTVDQENTCHDGYLKIIEERNCRCMGGAFGSWDWQTFVYADGRKKASTESDRKAAIEYFENCVSVCAYEIGPLVDAKENKPVAFEGTKKALTEQCSCFGKPQRHRVPFSGRKK